MPDSQCKDSDKSVVTLRNQTIDDGDSLTWKWMGEASPPTFLGDPSTDTGLRLCGIDSLRRVHVDATIPAGGTCGGKPCWKPLGKPPGSKGYAYRDRSGAVAGITQIIAMPGRDGKGLITIKAKGDGILARPSGTPLENQLELRLEARGCWSQKYHPSAAIKNDGITFKAKSP